MLRILLLFFYVNVAFSTVISQEIEFDSFDLPLLIIDTEDLIDIPDEPKILARLRIVDHDLNSMDLDPNGYDGLIAIEQRGNFSAGLPQKPYGFETQNIDGSNRNVPLLGMPSENDWILVANYNDKVMMRNTLTYHLFHEMGHYAPRTRYCEVILNGEYQGIYLLAEKIKQDKERVNISTLESNDVSGDELTGGYIFKIDYYDWGGSDSWVGNYGPENAPENTVRFVYYDPKARNLQTEQAEYLKNYVHGFEDVLFSGDFQDRSYGFKTYIDQKSFIDYLIISELSRNSDAYRKSKYYYKKKASDGGKIFCGPVWDYDWAYKNIYGGGSDGAGWAHITYDWMSPTPNGWIERMLKDDAFKNQVAIRYNELREGILSDLYLNNFVDEQFKILENAVTRHYERWPILGQDTGTPEGGEWQPDSYAGEITKFKNWLSVRLKWLDENIWEVDPSVEEDSTKIGSETRLFPNPSHGLYYIESEVPIQDIVVYNSAGALVRSPSTPLYDSYRKQVSLEHLQDGLYYIKVCFLNGEQFSQIISKISD